VQLVKYRYLFPRCISVRRLAPATLIAVVVATAITLAAAPLYAKSKPPPTKSGKGGSIQVGFIGVPPVGFQSALINVIAVSFNPKVNAAPSDPRWVNINVPIGPGVGAAAKPGVLQFDLNQIQTVPALFNTGSARPDTYQLVLITLDSVNPGTLVPTCPNAGALEGCINYPVQLSNPGIPIEFPLNTALPVTKNTLSQILFKVTMSIATAPTVTGGPYTVDLTVTPVSPNQFLASVNGTITGVKNSKKLKKVRSLAVTAEQMGTNTIVASAPVVSGNFTLSLPAAPDLGSLYDISVSGGKVTFDATRLAPLFPGQSATPTFSVKNNQKIGSISGVITDACTGQPIAGATLQLLLPPDTNSLANCATSPGECVTVASASTDNTGAYPIPGTAQSPAPFNSLPIGQNLTMEISAPGYDTLFSSVSATASSKKGSCTNSTTSTKSAGACNFSLTTAYIVGTLNLGANPPSGSNVMAEVFAEEHGTSNIVSALPAPLRIGSSTDTAQFTLNVPSKDPIGTFDLFASAIDLFQGAPDPYTGHSIEVASDVPPSSNCPATTTPTVTLGPMDCIGHGSITGVAVNPDTGTSVMLSKEDPANPGNFVDLMSALVEPVPLAVVPNNMYSFCAPGDTYDLQRLETSAPPNVVPDTPPSPVAVGSPQAVTVPPAPAASPTSTACPTTCTNPDGTCPGVCNNVIPSSLQP
jgi:hypothetical protein